MNLWLLGWRGGEEGGEGIVRDLHAYTAILRLSEGAGWSCLDHQAQYLDHGGFIFYKMNDLLRHDKA